MEKGLVGLPAIAARSRQGRAGRHDVAWTHAKAVGKAAQAVIVLDQKIKQEQGDVRTAGEIADIGGLQAGALVRLELDGERVTGEARHLQGIGRVREVEVARDGSILPEFARALGRPGLFDGLDLRLNRRGEGDGA